MSLIFTNVYFGFIITIIKSSISYSLSPWLYHWFCSVTSENHLWLIRNCTACFSYVGFIHWNWCYPLYSGLLLSFIFTNWASLMGLGSEEITLFSLDGNLFMHVSCTHFWPPLGKEKIFIKWMRNASSCLSRTFKYFRPGDIGSMLRPLHSAYFGILFTDKWRWHVKQTAIFHTWTCIVCHI